MQLFKKPTSINFMARRKLAMAVSLLFILVAIGSLAVRGLNLGIDFTGGSILEVGYPQAVELKEIRSALNKAGFDGATVQHFGTARDVLIKLAPRDDVSSEALSDKAFEVIRATDDDVQLRRQEFVGPQVGDELTEDGGLAMVYALIFILIYVALRFEYRFALGSVAALIHDVIIVLGLFSLLQLDFDLTVLAAVLAVIGYSLNDTIVVFDRIRENFRMLRKGSPEEVVNVSLNQTLSRTLITSLTTLLVLAALFYFGGELIHGFATALLVGVLVGTYSSIYVASATVLALGISKEDLMPVEVEGKDQDEFPPGM